MDNTQKTLQPSIMKIINKLVVQFATGLTKLDKRRLDAYAKTLEAMTSTPALEENLYQYIVKQAQGLTKNTTDCETVLKYLLDNELIKIMLSAKATVKLAISYEEFNILVKFISSDTTKEIA